MTSATSGIGSVLAAGRTIETKLPLTAGAAFTPVATATIKAPVPGTVQVNASISADDNTAVGAGKVQYQVQVGTTILNPTDSAAFLLDPVEGATTTRANGSITGVVRVPAKGTVPITASRQGSRRRLDSDWPQHQRGLRPGGQVPEGQDKDADEEADRQHQRRSVVL